MSNGRHLEKLKDLDDRLVRIVLESLEVCPVPFIVGCTSRTLSEQKQLFVEGKTKTMDSLHLKKPKSHAVDLFPIDKNGSIPWDKHRYFYVMAGCVLSIAKRNCRGQNWSVRWLGDSNSNGVLNVDDPTSSFVDLPHFELSFKK